MKMKIGEFAAFSNISIRALRLYDRMNLLQPACTDPETGYRSYDPDQIKTVYAIKSFQKFGFSLREIKDLLSPDMPSAALIQKLKDKMKQNETSADILRAHNESIQHMLDTYQVEIVESEQEAALRLSRIACLENDSLQNELSQILWL